MSFFNNYSFTRLPAQYQHNNKYAATLPDYTNRFLFTHTTLTDYLTKPADYER